MTSEAMRRIAFSRTAVNLRMGMRIAFEPEWSRSELQGWRVWECLPAKY